jgi:hypothetical protein
MGQVLFLLFYYLKAMIILEMFPLLQGLALILNVFNSYPSDNVSPPNKHANALMTYLPHCSLCPNITDLLHFRNRDADSALHYIIIIIIIYIIVITIISSITDGTTAW